jgi:transposase-like protein
MKKGHRVALEVKEQILGRIRNGEVTIAQAAKEHGLSDRAIYKWLGMGAQGAPTYGEVSKLRKENAGLKQLVGEITLKLSETQKKK